MAVQPLHQVLRHLRRAVHAHSEAALSDCELLHRFAECRDEAAFEELLRRHGPMVLRVGQRLLQHRQDAEDVFQATFLTLARKAGSIRKQASVGCWLHGVARILALQGETAATRRASLKAHAVGRTVPDPLAEITVREAEAVLDEELSRLPERLGAPLVLCYLEGATQDEAARQLGCSSATLRRRLERGRELLRVRLTRRGLTLSAVLLGTLLGDRACAAPPLALAQQVTDAARRMTAGQAAGVSANVTALLDGAACGLGTVKLKVAIGVLLMLGAVLALVSAATGRVRQSSSARQTAPTPQAKDSEKPPIAKERHTLKGHTVMVWAAAFSPDGKTLATAAGLYNKPGEVILWDAATGKVRAKVDQEKGVRALNFSPDGKTLATADYYSNKVTLRDPHSGKAMKELPTPHANNAVVFSPDGKLLAAAILNPNIQGVLWDVASGRELRQLSGHADWSSCVAFSPDGKLLATGSRDKTIKLWDVASGQPVVTLTGHEALIEFLAFSPDGHTLASASWDQTVRLWEVPLGKERAVLRGHKQQALSVNFSPDGRTLATTGGEVHDSPVDVNLKPGEVTLWNVSTLQAFASLRGQKGRIWMSCFSPDGRTLATVAEDKTIKLWDVAPSLVPPRGDATEKQLTAWWNDLAGDDATKAYRAVWALALSRPAVAFLERRIQPAAALPAETHKRIDKLIADLDDDNFSTRQRASLDLEQLGTAAEPALRKAHETTDSAEVRKRIETLLKTLRGPVERRETIQALRAIEALELADTDEAKRLLAALAKGGEHDRQTREAKAALERLARRKSR